MKIISINRILTDTVKTMTKKGKTNMKYRSESLYGSGCRDFIEVCTHDVYWREDYSIIDGLKDGLLQHSYLYERLSELSELYRINGYLPNFAETDCRQLFTACKDEIVRIYNIRPDYVLWLCDTPDMVRIYRGHEPLYDAEIDCYEETDFVVSSKDAEALYIYEDLPVPVASLDKIDGYYKEPDGLELG